ncbi:MAG: flagellar hook capping FlgD N-terminal domain-containing protein [Armatimonadota bacterium]
MNINGVSATSQTTATAANNRLGPDSFLRLLIAQLQTQDPLSPMDTTAMVNQMATMEMVSESRAARQSQDFIQAMNLMGKQVTWQDEATGAFLSGEVGGVVRDGSEARVVVEGVQVALTDILGISGAAAAADPGEVTP